VLVKDFDFDLPENLIAQSPLKKRSESRLLVVKPKSEDIIDEKFSDIVKYMKAGDVLVRNNTKVIPARLYGTKEETGALVEVLLLHNENDNWTCLVGNAKAVKLHTMIIFADGLLKAKCIAVEDEGIRVFQMIYTGIFYELLEKLGTVPLPPYIHEKLDDTKRYQTVYAKKPGSAAAPTAGFHFTDELFSEIKKKGVKVVDLTLHIGLSTFRPVKVSEVNKHIMHSEYYQLSQETADILNEAKKNKQRIIAVGTTSCRTLEANFSKFGCFEAEDSSTDIFIFPGYKFKAIDCLITNFHLPKSTLVMLVAALAGKDFILKAYNYAIEKGYRFFSFGDSMFISNE